MASEAEDELMAFAEEAGDDAPAPEPAGAPWRVLVVDDDIEVHRVTRTVLRGFSFRGRRAELIEAHSGAEARAILSRERDIALILLDVVMETDDAGLRLVEYVRKTLRDDAVRIILRTGQPGQAPERQVIVDYEINDYKAKTELTAHKLFTAVVTGLRSYCDIMARDAATAASRAKSEFLATISHEIRTPMTGVLGMTQMLLGTRLNVEQRDWVATIHYAGEALLAIVDDILDLSKIESGMLTLSEAEFDPRRLIESMTMLLSARALDKKITLTSDVATELPAMLRGDPDRLRQIMLHVIGNAVKYTDTGGVRVTATPRPGSAGVVTLDIAVQDTGSGIPEPLLRRLSTIRNDAMWNVGEFGGAGVGLAVAQRLTAALGGTLAIESTAGRGSLYRLAIPFAVAATPAAANPTMPAAAAQPRLTILLVDDEPINRRVIARLLERDGHKVTLATTGTEAIEAAAAAIYDIVLLDIRLPDMDGTQAARAIRALDDPLHAATPLLALTASVFPGDEDRYRDAGMSGVLLKPLRLAQLHAAMRDMAGVTPVTPTSGLPTLDSQRLENLREIFGPTELARLLDVLATSTETERGNLSAAVAAANWNGVASSASRMAGAASNYGFAALENAARNLEDAARAERVLAIPRLTIAIDREITSALARIAAVRRDAGG